MRAVVGVVSDGGLPFLLGHYKCAVLWWSVMMYIHSLGCGGGGVMVLAVCCVWTCAVVGVISDGRLLVPSCSASRVPVNLPTS